MNDEYYMKEAIKQAQAASDAGDWGIGCVVTCDGDIIGRGRNRVYSTRDRCAHAEMDVLRQLQEKLFDRSHVNDMVLYTTYVPCIMCFGALLMSGIRRVVAGVDYDDSGVSSYIEHIPRGFQNITYATTIRVGLLDKECAQVWLGSQPAKRLIAGGYTLTRSLDDLHGEIVEYHSPVVAGSER